MVARSSKEVEIIDINIPFISMVWFMVKLSIAAIPAGIIVSVLWLTLSGIILGGIASFF